VYWFFNEIAENSHWVAVASRVSHLTVTRSLLVTTNSIKDTSRRRCEHVLRPIEFLTN